MAFLYQNAASMAVCDIYVFLQQILCPYAEFLSVVSRASSELKMLLSWKQAAALSLLTRLKLGMPWALGKSLPSIIPKYDAPKEHCVIPV